MSIYNIKINLPRLTDVVFTEFNHTIISIVFFSGYFLEFNASWLPENPTMSMSIVKGVSI